MLDEKPTPIAQTGAAEFIQPTLQPRAHGKLQLSSKFQDGQCRIESLRQAGIEVLLDDRKARPGVMFADMELIGVPHRIVFGERGLDAGTVEYRERRDAENQDIPLDKIVNVLVEKLRVRESL